MTESSNTLGKELTKILNRTGVEHVKPNDSFDTIVNLIQDGVITFDTFALLQEPFEGNQYEDSLLRILQTALLGNEAKRIITDATVGSADRYVQEMKAPFLEFLFAHDTFREYKLFVILHQYRLENETVAALSPGLITNMDLLIKTIAVRLGPIDNPQVISATTELENLRNRIQTLAPIRAAALAAKPADVAPVSPVPAAAVVAVPAIALASAPVIAAASSKPADVVAAVPVSGNKPADAPAGPAPPIPSRANRPAAAVPMEDAAARIVSSSRMDGDQMIVSIRDKALQYPGYDSEKKRVPYHTVDCDNLEIDGSILSPKCLLYHFSDRKFFLEAESECSEPITRYLESVGRENKDTFSIASLFNVAMTNREQAKSKDLYQKLYSFAMCCLDLFLEMVKADKQQTRNLMPLAQRLQRFFLEVDDFIGKYTAKNAIPDARVPDSKIYRGNTALVIAYMAVSYIAIGKSIEKSTVLAYVNKVSSLGAKIMNREGPLPVISELEKSAQTIVEGKKTYDGLLGWFRELIEKLFLNAHEEFRTHFKKTILALISA